MLFFFNAPATTEIYTLSLHDALPISRGGKHAKGVPLFTYLYNEYIPEYTPSVSPSQGQEQIFGLGTLLVCGLPPVYNAGELQRDTGLAEQNTIDGIMAIFNSPGCRYLTMGKMLHPLKLDIPIKEMEFKKWNRRDEKVVSGKSFKFPVILHNVFANTYGKEVGAVFFNWTEETQKVEVPLSLFPLPKGTYDVWKYGKDGNTEKPLLAQTSLGQTVSI